MPELPEVETIRAQLAPRLEGRMLTRVEILDPRLTRPYDLFEVAEELPSLEKGQVPAYPLGTKHPEYADRHHLPFEASQGGAHTMYPEYPKRLQELLSARAATSSSAKRQ